MKRIITKASNIGLITGFWLVCGSTSLAQVSVSGSFTEMRMNQSFVSATVQYVVDSAIAGNIQGVRLNVDHVNPGTNNSTIRGLTVTTIEKIDSQVGIESPQMLSPSWEINPTTKIQNVQQINNTSYNFGLE